MKSVLIIFLFIITLEASEKPYQIKLIDSLDRPDDGYCLDILGSGKHMRPDMPLMGHNCKPGLYADEAFIFRKDGTIYSPVLNLCATIAGVNSYVLDYTSLVLKECNEDTPFVNAKFMQAFEYTKLKKIKHKNSNKCLEMGEESSRTFSPVHSWRTLYMRECSKTNTKRSTWYFNITF
ncbi:hypothetical protein CRV02_12350 [Arcobacter sp. CECT 8989]|uniref:ricin-type beta-trefoil lectin domain protein n=1 Tax=Arcobacter sp. CECT 8989 TaxID=2044509 RepID=UPI00100B8066|nr:ricin-type beta-trefoil lectin domain protein [Arcobacter sp. CECT 8989]RXJ98981.1 hypothetical protein CRV02_12350 [Arcobacter sp. CECT 8989]